MDVPQAERARQSYNRVSRIYWLLSDGSEKKFIRIAIRDTLEPREGESILEPGFGSGQALVALARMTGPRGSVSGLDASDGMVRAASRRLAGAGLDDRVELIRGDASRMPYPQQTFDAVFMSFTLELFPDDEIPVVIAECHRVLKEGGRICVACMSDARTTGVMVRLYAAAHRRWPHFVDCRPIDAASALRKAGFEVADEKALSMWGLPVSIVLAHRQT